MNERADRYIVIQYRTHGCAVYLSIYLSIHLTSSFLQIPSFTFRFSFLVSRFYIHVQYLLIYPFMYCTDVLVLTYTFPSFLLYVNKYKYRYISMQKTKNK